MAKSKKSKRSDSSQDDTGLARGSGICQISEADTAAYVAARDCGLYDKLFRSGLLVPHAELTDQSSQGQIVIETFEVQTITYPFEWSFSMLKDAALTLIRIQEQALEQNLILKNASAYDIQFIGGLPLLTNSRCFGLYHEGQTWPAYGQFCRHFLAPLALMAHVDLRMSQMLRDYADGIPLDLAGKILPGRARYKPAMFMHIMMHAKTEETRSKRHNKPLPKVGKQRLLTSLASLERLMVSMKPYGERVRRTQFHSDFSDEVAQNRNKLLKRFVSNVKPGRILDAAGRDGCYSRMVSNKNTEIICAAADPAAVEANYKQVRQADETNLLPLLIDFTAPGGALGWANEQYPAVSGRLRADMVIALAIVHHWAIAGNIKFIAIAEYLSRFAPYLVIEFVPLEDLEVQRLFAVCGDRSDSYTQERFEAEFGEYYVLEEKEEVPESGRVLYLFSRKTAVS